MQKLKRVLKIIKQMNFSSVFNRFLNEKLLYKVIALVISVCCWALIISQDPQITRDKSFENVKVSISGSDTLKKNGFIILDDIDKNPLYANFIASVPQLQYKTAKTSNYSPRIDLSVIENVGEVTIPIQTYNTSMYGSVSSINPSEITLNVDNYVTQYRVPIQYEIIGDYPVNIYGTEPFLDPNSLEISGPKTVVDKIAKGVVYIDPTKYKDTDVGQKRYTLPYILLDKDNNKIDTTLVSVYYNNVEVKNILVTQHIYLQKSFNLSSTGILDGEVNEGYYIKGIKISPSVIYLAGSAELLNNIDNVFPAEQINVNGRSRSFTQTINLNIPAESVYSSSKTAVVAVEVEPVINDKIIKEIPIEIKGKNDAYSYEISTKKVDTSLKGPMNDLDKIRAKNLLAELDVSSLEKGMHRVPLSIKLNYKNNKSIEISSTVNEILVNITEKN